MAQSPEKLTRQRLTTPRAAAVAGILFAILFTTSVALIYIFLPNTQDENAAVQVNAASYINLAVSLAPFAGIAFLWFMGVVRDRLGAYEDQFFSTIFYGSGLLFLAMVFAASASAGGIMAFHTTGQTENASSEIYQFGRAMISHFFSIYALRMAGVFVISLGTIWLRTGLMPRWLSFITFIFALFLMLSTAFSIWMVLVFPTWVFIISIYILVINLRGGAPGAADGVTV